MSAAFVVLLFAFPWEDPHAPVSRYHESVPADAVKPTRDEVALHGLVEDTFRLEGVDAPLYDPSIALACRRICEVLDCTDMDSVQAWEPQTIQFALRSFGITDAFYFPLVAQVDSAQEAGRLLNDVISRDLGSMRVNRYGLALQSSGTRMFAAVFTRRLAQLGPFPRVVEPGSTHLLYGALLQDSTDPTFILATPESGTLQQPPHRSDDILWNPVYFPDEPGEYILELMVRNDGPQVASLFPVYVGIEPPERPVFKLYPGIDESSDRAAIERQLFKLINRERHKRHVPDCTWSPLLARGARAYSRTMAAAGRLSHALSRADGDLTTAYTENISLSTSLHAAHANLMASPSHQRNVVDPEVRFCAVGIQTVQRAGDSRLYYITQRFSRKVETAGAR